VAGDAKNIIWTPSVVLEGSLDVIDEAVPARESESESRLVSRIWFDKLVYDPYYNENFNNIEFDLRLKSGLRNTE
jgi:hypothetical protein